ncbi:MAG: hypothetical protein ACHQ4J_07600 [Candidatus Binatia bacterium]
MSSLPKRLLFAAGTAGIVVILGLRADGARAPKQVNIANSPLPIQGTLTVSGAVSLNPTPLTVKGTVSLAPNTSINIANPQATPMPIRNVDNPALQPFQTEVQINLDDGTSMGAVPLTGPDNAEIVIEYLSAIVDVPSGEKALFSVETTGGCSDVVHDGFPATFARSPGEGTDELVLGRLTQIYADPGSTVTLAVSRSQSTGAITATLSLSGYLVSPGHICPTPTPIPTATPTATPCIGGLPSGNACVLDLDCASCVCNITMDGIGMCE